MSNLTFPFITIAKPKPLLKWAGGKSRLLPQYVGFFPSTYNHYFEPFLGGGAVFFHLQPPQATLFDLNAQLIEVYKVVQSDVEALIAALKHHFNNKDYFYEVRAQDPSDLSAIQRAARIIFLNKTCYNGLYRVNQKGQFNVPFGNYKNPTICDAETLRSAAIILQQATLEAIDFEKVLDYAQSGDFVYLDPPYEPLSATSNFTSYTKHGFTRADQYRLADVFRQLDQRGCHLMMSNSNSSLIHHLYRKYRIHNIKARRAINSNPNGRGEIIELLVTNYES